MVLDVSVVEPKIPRETSLWQHLGGTILAWAGKTHSKSERHHSLSLGPRLNIKGEVHLEHSLVSTAWLWMPCNQLLSAPVALSSLLWWLHPELLLLSLLLLLLLSNTFFSAPHSSSLMLFMLPIYSGDLVFFYFPCRLDLCKSLLVSSLLSKFSGVVVCKLAFFAFCLKTTCEWVYVIIVFLCLGYLTQNNVF